ncbi:hypothetical protein K435DRAFT_782764 [Dendrothele bispora CBS 962.96]|uniref:DUF6699 domain-containing protein n=1 Tax=Dendrothele bispora (strain CBS 962.96) TaxID=1314807 RepID=A0A4S8LDH9_DENBC|nr:hypothetical protein K435DRAFT_782764 [Dendrothele bispora CBS 962.96]
MAWKPGQESFEMYDGMPQLVDAQTSGGGGGGGVIPPPPGATFQGGGGGGGGGGLNMSAFPGQNGGGGRRNSHASAPMPSPAFPVAPLRTRSQPQPQPYPHGGGGGGPPEPQGWNGPGADRQMQANTNFGLNAFPNFPATMNPAMGMGAQGYSPHTPYMPTPFMGPHAGGYGFPAFGGGTVGGTPYAPAFAGLPGFGGGGGGGGGSGGGNGGGGMERGLLENHREYEQFGRGGQGPPPFSAPAGYGDRHTGGGNDWGFGGITEGGGGNWFGKAAKSQERFGRGRGSRSRHRRYPDNEDDYDEGWEHLDRRHYPEERYRGEGPAMSRQQLEEMERRQREEYLMGMRRREELDHQQVETGRHWPREGGAPGFGGGGTPRFGGGGTPRFEGGGGGYDWDAMDRGGFPAGGVPGTPHVGHVGFDDLNERGRSLTRTKEVRGRSKRQGRGGGDWDLLEDLGINALSLEDFPNPDEDIEYDRLRREQKQRKKERKRAKEEQSRRHATPALAMRANSRSLSRGDGVRLGYRDPVSAEYLSEFDQARFSRALAYQQQVEAERHHQRYPRPLSWRGDYSARGGFLARVMRAPSQVQELPPDGMKRTAHGFLKFLGEEVPVPAISMDLRMNPKDTESTGAACRVNMFVTNGMSEVPISLSRPGSYAPSGVQGVYFLSIPRLGRDLTKVEMMQPACQPPTPFMRCYHPRLPWYVDIQCQPGGPGFVTVWDVLWQMWIGLQQRVGEAEYWSEEMDDDPREVEREVRATAQGRGRSRVRESMDEQYGVGRRFIGKAWRDRCWLVGLANGDEPLPPDQRAAGFSGVREKEEMMNGVKRVDFLGAEGRLRFVGLARGRGGMWEIKTERV